MARTQDSVIYACVEWDRISHITSVHGTEQMC
jgi:hypothetical protein